jgi:tRNA G18 (ribose-2'-O)-methylase SpoU
VSMGQVFALPYAFLDSWPGGLEEVRTAGFRLLALTPREGATDLGALRLGPDERAALVFGAEGPGLSQQVLDLADEQVRIPMARGVDSLNVAAAAAVACWELGRR